MEKEESKKIKGMGRREKKKKGVDGMNWKVHDVTLGLSPVEQVCGRLIKTLIDEPAICVCFIFSVSSFSSLFCFFLCFFVFLSFL